MPPYEDHRVPPAVLEHFGSDRARPRVASAHTERWGFRKVKGRPVLTAAVAVHLGAQGVDTVELVWRWRRVRMNVTTGFRSVWGAGAPRAPKEGEVPASAEVIAAA